MKEVIYSPISGISIPIEKVDDPVFAEKMLGDGLAITPNGLGKQIISAPCDGSIETLQDTNHALALKSKNGYEVLIHVGIDTVSLKGKGFKALTKKGASVKKGDELLEVDFDVLVKEAPSIDVIIIFTNLTDDIKLNTHLGDIVSGANLCILSNEDDVNNSFNNEINSGSSELESEKITVLNPTGIHARPASAIFQIASKYKSDIKIKKDGRVVNAKSIVAILSLGIKFEEQISITASGEDAQDAIDSIAKEIKSGLGEKVISQVSDEQESEEFITLKDGDTLQGSVASPGIHIGQSFTFKDEELSVTNIKPTPEDLNLLKNALDKLNKKLSKEIQQAKKANHPTKAEILQAHLTMLSDPGLIEPAEDLIKAGKAAAYAWKHSTEQAIEGLKGTGNTLLMERVADLKDLQKRILKILLGLDDVEDNVNYPDNTIIVAEDLIPSDLSNFDDNVKGVVLTKGSTTSHVSLMLRNMGIPTLVAIGSAGKQIKDKVPLVLDADKGILVVNPPESLLSDIKIKKEHSDTKRAKNIANTKAEAITVDGVKIKVKGNVGNPLEAKRIEELGAEGIGLLRTEFLFFNSTSEPEIQEQTRIYQLVVDAITGGSVTIRTLDVGGDKPLSFLHIAKEENPIVGMRGVRNYFTNKALFARQIKAILQVKPLETVKIMIPMVANVQEIIDTKAIIEEEKKKLGISTEIQIGTMVEVPSAALIAEQIAPHVDFFSIGTNDLAQYTLAMDRGNSILTKYLKNLHPAVLKLIKMTVDGGNQYNIPTAVCGAMASEIVSVPILIGLGVKELSTSMKSVPDIRALIRELSYEQCKEIANKALTMSTAEEVQQLVEKEINL